MASSGISAASTNALSQAVQSLGQHKHKGHHAPSLSDVDAGGSSAAATKSATGKVGNKINITA